MHGPTIARRRRAPPSVRVRVLLSLVLGACSCGPRADGDRAPPRTAASAHEGPDLVQVRLPGWSATPGQTPFERFVDYGERARACVVRVTHWLPVRPGDPAVQPSPVTVLGRRDVAIDGQPFVLIRTSEAGNPQSVSIDRAGRSAMLRFTGCDDATIDRVLAQAHLAGAASR